MAHKQGGEVKFPSYFCILGTCINTEQGFLGAGGHLARIRLVKPVYDLLRKRFGACTFNERVFN